jgi:hypothetical protein
MRGGGWLLGLALVGCAGSSSLRAGAAAADITPTQFPVVVNGMFQERTADRAHDRLEARALVMDDGRTKLAIVVVDSLMMPRALLDRVKERASRTTGIPSDRMLIAATHTHSAPSVMGCLGSGVDPNYPPFLEAKIVEAIERAAAALGPARASWNVTVLETHAHCRRWIFRPDRIGNDPFGNKTVRANMHPGYQSPNHIGPSGPADATLSILRIQSSEGRPIAVLANYPMHYKGSEMVSGDACGRFGPALRRLMGADDAFVAMLSQGCSGDAMWMDYGRPANDPGLDRYVEELARAAKEALPGSAGESQNLAMAEATLRLRRRVPDEARLAWARKTFPFPPEHKPEGMAQIYAREALLLHAEPEVELKIQAIRVGALGIVGIPNEVYGLTGMKIKARSPLEPTFVIELANGAEGYIPPPEQHALGGYTTWPARTAGLEVQAEPKIVETALGLLERVADKPRRSSARPPGPYARAVLSSRPAAFWAMDEMAGADAAGRYEDGVVFFLDGPRGERAAHFAGGRMRANVAAPGAAYGFECWFWNGLPNNARPVTGYFFSRGADGAEGAPGDHLGISGTGEPSYQGRVMFYNGNKLGQVLVGRTRIEPKTWNHVALVRDGPRVAVYLNGSDAAEIDGEAAPGCGPGVETIFLGGRSDNFANFEGRIYGAAVYDRALTVEEIVKHAEAGGVGP